MKEGSGEIMHKTSIINKVMSMLCDRFSSDNIEYITQCLTIVMNDYDFSEKQTALACTDSDIKTRALQMFFIAKKMEGCTDRTLQYYGVILRKFFSAVNVPIDNISADDIRIYIAKLSIEKGCSKATQDNELRVLKSFFKWCFGEGYITRQPTLNIKRIKQEKRLKKGYTETELEIMRQNASANSSALKAARDTAILDVLFSTGARVSELVGIDISDISGDEITIFGKGEKERIVYLNARAKLSIEQYLSLREDNGQALFVSTKSPYNRLSKSAVEAFIRSNGTACGIKKAHPHRFRRTAATLALNRGMPIEQVSKMLGHENIETTTIYARSDEENVKASHKKFVI